MMKFFKGSRKYWLIGTAIVVIAGLFLVYKNGNGNGNVYELYIVKAQDLIHTVEVTGILNPSATLDLSFQSGGEVNNIYFDVGDEVEKGQTIAELENADERANLSKAQASLNEAQANLNLKLADATNEDIAIAKASLDKAKVDKKKIEVDLQNAKSQLDNVKKSVEQDILSAEIALDNAELDLEKAKTGTSNTSTINDVSLQNTINSVYSSIGQLISNASITINDVDKFFGAVNYSSIVYDVTYVGPDSIYNQTERIIETNHEILLSLTDDYVNLGTDLTTDNLDEKLSEFDDFADSLRTMINNGLIVIEDIRASSQFYQNELDSLKANFRTSSGSLDRAIDTFDNASSNYKNAMAKKDTDASTSDLDVQSAELAVEQAKQTLEQKKIEGDIRILDAENNIKTLEAQLEVQDALIESAQASYDKVLADPRSVDIAPFRAMVDQANALVLSAQASLDKTIIKAPVTGILSKKNVEIGEKVGGIAGNEAFGADFQLIDDNDFYIEINIPETQVNKVERENEVSITFDSIDNEEFAGTLVSIDPGATEIDGVIYYQADIKIVDEDERLKAGMTADLVLNAEPKVNVLVIPEIAVLTEDGEKWVRLPINGSTERYEKVPVRVGTRGNGGQIEVTSGLEEGQTILVPKV